MWTLKRSKGRVCVSPIDAKKKAKGHNKGFPVKQHRESLQVEKQEERVKSRKPITNHKAKLARLRERSRGAQKARKLVPKAWGGVKE